jgi:hypothetical protein
LPQLIANIFVVSNFESQGIIVWDFGDLELNDANSGAEVDGVQLANWAIGQGKVELEEYVEELARQTLNWVLERRDGECSRERLGNRRH